MADWSFLKRGDAMWYQSEERTSCCVCYRCNFVDAEFWCVITHANQRHCGNCSGDYQAKIACNQNSKDAKSHPLITLTG